MSRVTLDHRHRGRPGPTDGEMTIFWLHHDHQRINPDAAAALQRFERDVKLITPSERGCTVSTGTLQARAIRAYRTALVEAVGRPCDRSWFAFVGAVAALLAAPDIAQADVAAAASRFHVLLDENADLLR